MDQVGSGGVRSGCPSLCPKFNHYSIPVGSVFHSDVPFEYSHPVVGLIPIGVGRPPSDSVVHYSVTNFIQYSNELLTIPMS